MRTALLISCIIYCSLWLIACNGGTSTSKTGKTSSTAKRLTPLVGGYSGSEVFIPADSANKMISSYLSSINAGGGGSDTLLKSLIFNADSLRAYLSDTNIKHVKVMFAHTLEYINANGAGQNVGYESGALTVVFGGYDQDGNYVFWQTDRVPDRGNPCPTNCDVTGNASSDLFPVSH